jgi:hypothetical protein
MKVEEVSRLTEHADNTRGETFTIDIRIDNSLLISFILKAPSWHPTNTTLYTIHINIPTYNMLVTYDMLRLEMR